MVSEKEIEAAMSEWNRALINAPNESVYERRRRCIHAALSAAARVRAEDIAREPAMNVRKALNSMVEALEKMGFVILSQSEWEAKDREISELREALEKLLVCPAEQAVTEEMVARASAEYQEIFGKHLLSSHARRILEAAMDPNRSYPSVKTAKDAALADYESRILSALEDYERRIQGGQR